MSQLLLLSQLFHCILVVNGIFGDSKTVCTKPSFINVSNTLCCRYNLPPPNKYEWNINNVCVSLTVISRACFRLSRSPCHCKQPRWGAPASSAFCPGSSPSRSGEHTTPGARSRAEGSGSATRFIGMRTSLPPPTDRRPRLDTVDFRCCMLVFQLGHISLMCYQRAEWLTHEDLLHKHHARRQIQDEHRLFQTVRASPESTWGSTQLRATDNTTSVWVVAQNNSKTTQLFFVRVTTTKKWAQIDPIQCCSTFSLLVFICIYLSHALHSLLDSS